MATRGHYQRDVLQERLELSTGSRASLAAIQKEKRRNSLNKLVDPLTANERKDLSPVKRQPPAPVEKPTERNIPKIDYVARKEAENLVRRRNSKRKPV